MSETGTQTLELALAKASVLQLIKCTEVVKRRSEALLLQKAKLSLRGVWVLIAAGSEANATQKQLAKHLALNQNSMVQLLDALEKSGHVRRITNVLNRREQFVRLTPKGRAILRRLFAERASIYRAIFAPLDESKIAALVGAAEAFLAQNPDATPTLDT